jgi:hypothetical protein
MLAAAIQAFKGLSGKVKCQTMGIDFSDEGWKDQSAHFKVGHRNQRPKAAYSQMY